MTEMISASRGPIIILWSLRRVVLSGILLCSQHKAFGLTFLQTVPHNSLRSQSHICTTRLTARSSLFSSRDTATKKVNATGTPAASSSSSSSTSTAPTTATLLAKVVQSATTKRNQTNVTANSSNDGDSNDLAFMPDKMLAGIGGLNGTSFDVNRLKRNLLQEVVQSYKQELHALLQSYDSTEQEIIEKLSALVQSSPVRTTTDSNLLDGRWALAYRSKHCVVRDLKQRPARLPKRQRQQQAMAQNVMAASRKSGKDRVARKFFRTVHLEQEDDDVAVEDSMHLFGPLLKRTERHRVCGLTRQSLVIQRQSSKWYFMHRLVKQRIVDPRQRNTEEPQQNVQVVYLDVDLCILTTSDDDLDGDNATFSVYTKNDAYLSHSTQRQVGFVLQAVRSFVFGKLLRKRNDSLDEYWWSGRDTDEVNRILQEIRIENSSRLRVLRLGDTGDVDEAWEGKGDPFVHLSADERQKAIKAMSMRQIELAGNKRLSKAKRESWFQRLIPRKKSFRRPKKM